MACMHTSGTYCDECRSTVTTTHAVASMAYEELTVQVPKNEAHARAMLAVATAYLKDLRK